MTARIEAESASPYFSIVIPAYNEEDHIGSCLQSIFTLNYDSAKYEVIVVDNGSQDRSYEIALNFDQAKVFQLLEGNVGAVRNHGAAQARGQILIFIDADCLMDEDWLNRAEQLINDWPNYVYGGGVKLPIDATWIETSWLLESKGQPTLPKHLIGASTVLSTKLFWEINGYNELVSSGEDTDLHNRLTSNNSPVLIDHALDVTHLGNAKTLMQFLQRQIWHSENYISNIIQSVKDPVFLATSVFIILPFFVLIQSIFLSSSNITIISLLSWGSIPFLLSLKRMSRSRYFTLNPINIFSIYVLDFIYLAGRSLGLLKGFFNLVRLHDFGSS
ncbi:Glycosyltransferase involved in cell wall bisynthesis [Marinobacter sp. LV10R510-11A]|uniref:glycosyltransferase n=1 Tax=Marinobacter sp. LV10R510-11A TaxID=1415568 RepID=UPI000BB7914F|nr:glycosyltransferase family 2 protein [Marinobacter sp. LV10R510-11A]SOB75158.1 Glycosyltransferase involved in cell wall bisynthesis [Marinobacter sp. LV10R510-11A]